MYIFDLLVSAAYKKYQVNQCRAAIFLSIYFIKGSFAV